MNNKKCMMYIIGSCFLFLSNTLPVMAEQQITIDVGQKFSEKFVKLEDSETVYVINRDIKTHKLVFKNRFRGSIVVELESGKTKQVKLEAPGVYDVQCDNHPGMALTVFLPRYMSTNNIDVQKSY